MGSSGVTLQRVAKRYGQVEAVRPLDLALEPGEFLTLLGPSGCGKTTLLRMVAGLEAVSGGRILIGPREVQDLPPEARGCAIMFQDYALFPHRTLLENVAFGPKMRGVARAERERTARGWLAKVGLEGFERRLPAELSGGQKQRVALARALAAAPSVLLLDEPLGALDADLRRQMQVELKRVHRETGLTFLYVTHDQEEAMAMSDRIAVLRAGRIEQLDTPERLYARPRSRFVARFVGECNLLDAVVEGMAEGLVACRCGPLGRVLARAPETGPPPGPGEAATLAVRPQHLRLAPGGPGDAAGARIVDRLFTGAAIRLVTQGPGGEALSLLLDPRDLPPALPADGRVALEVAPGDAVLLPGEPA